MSEEKFFPEKITVEFARKFIQQYFAEGREIGRTQQSASSPKVKNDLETPKASIRSKMLARSKSLLKTNKGRGGVGAEFYSLMVEHRGILPEIAIPDSMANLATLSFVQREIAAGRIASNGKELRIKV